MSEHLPLTLDELLTTTRAVRQRLDWLPCKFGFRGSWCPWGHESCLPCKFGFHGSWCPWGHESCVANFAQEVMKRQLSLSVRELRGFCRKFSFVALCGIISSIIYG